MDAAQGDGHAPNLHRQRIAPREDAAIGKRDPRASIKAKRLQALCLFGNERRPIDRRDSRWRAKRELIECHPFALP